MARVKAFRYSKNSKYNAKKTVVDGISFDSKAEAVRYNELKALLERGIIKDLRLQPRFLLQNKFELEGKTYRKIEYVADFSYLDCNTGKYIVEDVKGVLTDVYKLKKKIFLYLYGTEYEFREIKG